jgi:hypothetical protein
MRRCLVFVLFVLATVRPALGQQAPAASEPPLRRWFEIQNLTLYSRYQFIRNSAEVVTASHPQYKDTFRARFNFDAQKRYTINAGAFSGGTFVSTWDNYGYGPGGARTTFEYLKQLYGAAIPVRGLELQYGGLYIARGETDEFTSYDDDGYLAGERVIVRRPKNFYLDEVSFTRALIGPYETPDLTRRWNGLSHPNYWQALAAKRFGRLGSSLDYTSQSGRDTVRAAVTMRFAASAPVNTVRYEQYKRLNSHPAAGFALWAERGLTRFARLQAGYISVDEFYGPTDTPTSAREWNADRVQRGRRFFGAVTVPIYGPLSASLYLTQALHSPYTVPVARRFDAIVLYDVLDTLRKSHLF